jgi:SAM-dependent methyltransferase
VARSLVPAFEKTYRTQDYRKLPWFSPRPPGWVVYALRQRWIRPSRSLDIGCGAGTLALWLAKRGFSAVGLDASASAVAIAARRRGPGRRNPSFRVGSALALPFPARSFDLATDIGVLHTFSLAQRRRYARSLARVLRPGGSYLTTVFAREEQRIRGGPPYRLSVADVVDLLEPQFELRHFAPGGWWDHRDAPRTYAFHFRRRKGRQPSARPIW